jgi:hypothetical protein
LLRTRDEARAEVQRLQGLVEQRGRTIEALTSEKAEAKQRHQADLDTISAFCNAEADERGYCDTYDSLMRDLDRQLHGNLTYRRRTFTVRAILTLNVPVSWEVEATTADEACDMDPNTDFQRIVRQTLNDGNYELDEHEAS